MAVVLEESFGSDTVHWTREPAGISCSLMRQRGVATKRESRASEVPFMTVLLSFEELFWSNGADSSDGSATVRSLFI
jgi:hypothetical protein